MKSKAARLNAAKFATHHDDVFGRIATRYDRLCDLFSLGIHRLWKRRVADIIASKSWSRMLDTATGTGHIVLRLANLKTLDPATQHIIASDISPQMLAIAEQRLEGAKIPVQIEIQDAQALDDIEDASFDLYSMSLGLKICDRSKVLQEAYRILKPDGHLVVLEASNISWRWLQLAYLVYMRCCMPMLGWLATGGDASAYRYLLDGIEQFPTAEELADELRDLGFKDVAFERRSLGIVAIHSATKSSAVPSTGQ